MAFWGKKDKQAESREDRNKSGPIRKLWRKFRNINWKNPVNRWKLLLFSLIGSVIVFGGGYGVLSFTNSPSFCASCHEMTPEYTTYTASAHDQISCVQCHIKPGFSTMIVHKMKSLKEVYYHVTGVPKQIVQTEDEAVSNESCLQCHSKNRMVTASEDLKVDHQKHIDEGIPCITCHSGVVHAKIASRELNVGDDRTKWNTKTAQKLIEEKYLQTNMGTCIDCHNKVNKGEKPWEDINYSIPANPEQTGTEVPSKKTEKASEEKGTQQIILESIHSNATKQKISMACSTCHNEKIGIPKDHQAADWNNNHTMAAASKLDSCLNCHQDSKWEKAITKQDITTLLKYGDASKKYTPNLETAKQEAKNNTFCNTCHTHENVPSQSSS